MLKSSFTPTFSTFPAKSLSPRPLHRAIFSCFTHSAPTVRQNASPNFPTNILPPPSSAYIHLPFCRKRCHYCDFTIVALGSSSTQTDDDPRMTNYVQLLCREINATKPENKPNPPLETVFFGGGTPSLVTPKLVASILNTLSSNLGLSSDAEISMEMDPGTFDAQKMKEMMALGVNRVSLGVQAFQEELLKACGRAHGIREVYEAIDIVGSCEVENWSVDLISSLPHQTPEMWEESLRLTVEAHPTHVSVYDLQVEQGTKFGSLYTPGEFPLPSESRSAEFYRMASRRLANAGYNHYEISSYCKSGYHCQHNLTYWKNKHFYAFGLGSASYVDGVRFSRPKRMKEYMGYVENLENGLVDRCESNRTAQDMATDVVMLSLRTSRGLDLRSFGDAYGSSLVFSLCKAYKPYVESGHVVFLDEQRRAMAADEFNALQDKIERGPAYIRLSDPDGFLLSNELISLAFAVVAP